MHGSNNKKNKIRVSMKNNKRDDHSKKSNNTYENKNCPDNKIALKARTSTTKTIINC